VSQSTVSRALSGAGVVSEETRQKVAEAARQLNYKIDANARNLRLQSAKTIALLMYEDPVTSGSLINPFFLSMLSSTIKAAGRRGYDLVISFQDESDDNADYVGSHRADGIIFFGYGDYVRYADRMARLDAARVPSVTWGPVAAGQPGHFIGSDNIIGAMEGVAHLIARGRRRIAFLGHHSEHTPEFLDRYRGYEQALSNAGLPLIPGLQRACDISEEAGHREIQALLGDGAQFDAVFAACDLIAIGAMKGLREHGLTIPKDVAVMGFDDIIIAAFTDPPLTTVRQNTEAAGELMVETLIDQIEGRIASSKMIPTKLVVRGSCG
jgi:DNA-binding LacI/PurR family transcriptional regulator